MTESTGKAAICCRLRNRRGRLLIGNCDLDRPADLPCDGRTQPFAQLRPAASARDVAHRDGDGLLLPDQHNQPLAACDASVEQVSLEHRVMLSEHWDDHRWIFGALAFVNGRRVSGHQHVEFQIRR